MELKLIAHGAEAKIYLYNNIIIKHRMQKHYRAPEIDLEIRKKRTNTERKVLMKLAANGVNVPALVDGSAFKDQFDSKITIFMSHVEGVPLKKIIKAQESDDKSCLEGITISLKEIFVNIGIMICKMHDCGIIHGDLTTANFVLQKNAVYMLDFGLSYFSTKEEDKAVDLFLFEKSIRAMHSEKYMSNLFDGYGVERLVSLKQKLDGVRMRGRKIGM